MAIPNDPVRMRPAFDSILSIGLGREQGVGTADTVSQMSLRPCMQSEADGVVGPDALDSLGLHLQLPWPGDLLDPRRFLLPDAS